MIAKPRHRWIIAPHLRDRQAYWSTMELSGSAYTVDCHRTLRGPYTGVGSLLRQMVPLVHQQVPEHVQAHIVEILSLAPELGSFLATSQQTLTSLAIPDERTRFYSRARTLRLAHGIIDFLKGCISLGVYGHLTLSFDNLQAADTLDQELLAVLLRRADPATLTVVIGSTPDSLPETLQSACLTYTEQVQVEPLTREIYAQQLQNWHISEAWQDWLFEHGQGWWGTCEPLQDLAELLAANPPSGETLAEGMQALVEQAPVETRVAWARAYIDSDCTSDTLLESIAYDLLDATTRQQWHDARAEELEQQDQWSLHLGAIPYHRERGSSPSELGAKALQKALDYCINMGYYEATVDLGYRGRAVIDRTTQLLYYWTFTTKNTTSLAALGRPREAAELYNEARALSSRPSLHMQAAYATAMLYTRHFQEDQRDHVLAKGWINAAIALASMFPDPKERAFNTVFNQNGLALIEAHLRHPEEAIRLVTEGLERLNRELEPDEHRLHRSVLLYNRGQVYASLGKLDEALADYTAVIAQDPYYSEYYFDRGNLYRRLERNEEALADYERAIAYSPPYLETYYNRAGVLSVLGREDEALADYNYVLELDPTHLDALINRASILYERGEYAEARSDVQQGLVITSDNAQLLCTLGLLEIADEHPDEAYRILSAAIAYDSSLVAAWTNRAILSFEGEKYVDAINDLTQALTLEENATVLYNRGIAYQTYGSWQEAIDDFSHALSLDEEDVQDILYRRGCCHLQLGNTDQAERDFAAHLAYGPSPYGEDLSQLKLSLLKQEEVRQS